MNFLAYLDQYDILHVVNKNIDLKMQEKAMGIKWAIVPTDIENENGFPLVHNFQLNVSEDRVPAMSVQKEYKEVIELWKACYEAKYGKAYTK